MITAQDIREKTFEKARFNGYDMASVDDFLDELAEELEASQKETAILKSKMKVCVDEIERLRSNKQPAAEVKAEAKPMDLRSGEEAVSRSIISAQKLAVQIENEARANAAAIVAEAEKQAKETVGSIADQVAYEEKRLAAAKEVYARFVAGVREACNKQLENIDKISAGVAKKAEPAPAAQPAPEAEAESVDETVRSIQSSVAQAPIEEPLSFDVSSLMDDVKTSSKNIASTQPFTL